MQGLRDFGNALVVALISIGLMIGALSISLVEFVPEATPTATNNQLASPIPLTATPTLPPTETPTFAIESPTPSITSTFEATATYPSNCLIPTGWTAITVQPGQTLDSIAFTYRTNADTLKQGNCLLTNNLVAGTTLYVPAVAPNTPVACIPGAVGWTKNYVVQPKDTLYAIGTNHYTTVDTMRRVNCRVGDTIFVGEVLWIPNVASRTPYPSPLPGTTVTPYPTDPLTETALPFTLTPYPTDTLVPTNTPVPTNTSVPPSATLTPFPN
ncbi:MAG: LysM peptidoglycan-binding domain-containing protein [Anaerolineales bacterium]